MKASLIVAVALALAGGCKRKHSGARAESSLTGAVRTGDALAQELGRAAFTDPDAVLDDSDARGLLAEAGFAGRPGWLVVADRFDAYEPALQRALALRPALSASVLLTSLCQGLEPDRFAVVAGTFATRAEAERAAGKLPS